MQWLKSKPSLPPGLHLDESEEKAKESSASGQSKSAKKNKKRKEKKKEQKQSEAFTIEEVTDSFEKVSMSAKSSCGLGSQPVISGEGAHTDSSKRLRNLRKKLNQIDELQAKVNAGEITKLEKEQEEKLARRQEVVDEIEDLVSELSHV